MRYLNPTNDYAFKRVFGNEQRKQILISFLNSVLGKSGDEEILEVTLLNPYQAPHILDSKETVLDVRCKDQAGIEYIVEMQILYQEYFDKRVLYYVSKSYSSQLIEGQEFETLSPIIFLGILNFKFTDKDHYVSTHLIREVETSEHVFKDFQFTFVELPKFNKDATELETIGDKWIYFLKNAKDIESIPTSISEVAIKEAFEIVDRVSWDRTELELYDARIRAWRDIVGQTKYQHKIIAEKAHEQGHRKGHKEGHKEGRKEGRKEGHKEGHKKGLKEGFEAGTQQQAERAAIALLQAGTQEDLIRLATGLSQEQLARLKKN